jgi:hypothetical protein
MQRGEITGKTQREKRMTIAAKPTKSARNAYKMNLFDAVSGPLSLSVFNWRSARMLTKRKTTPPTNHFHEDELMAKPKQDKVMTKSIATNDNLPMIVPIKV